MFTQDFILNGEGHGAVAETLAGCRFDPGLLRPYFDRNGRKCVTVNTGRTKFNGKTQQDEPIYENRSIADLERLGIHSPVFNATSLRKQEWIRLDTAVQLAARQRLRAWKDLEAANSYGGFNGMNYTVLEHETMSDPGEAIVDMDAITEGRGDEPIFQLEGLPLPITHSSFFFSSRQIAVSRNVGRPVSTIMAEAAGRRVAEMVEQTLIGTQVGLTYGVAASYSRAPTVYGYTNFPPRVAVINMAIPTGANGAAVLASWLAFRELMYGQNHYGPFMAYTSTDYDQFLDNVYIPAEPSAGTLRERLLKIDGISGIRRLDYLTPASGNAFTVILVQMTGDVAQAVNGMGLTTVQWETRGGMQLNFKVMCILVPRLRADYYGQCGIGHGRTAA